MQASHTGTMYYHADGCPIGGYLKQPVDSALLSQASVSLGPAGGHAAARVESFKLDEIISGPAYSHTTGSVQQNTGHWTTQVTAVVENLSMYGVLTADKIVSQLSLKHRRSGGHPSVSFAGSHFENLRIDGKPVDAAVSPAMLTATEETIEFPDVPWPEVPGFAAKVEAKSQTMTGHEKAPDWLKARYQWIQSKDERTRRGYTLCSLIEEVKGTASDSTFGHVIHVPDFGNIFLGELIVNRHAFHLSMLRIEMGCKADGNVSFASTGGNGAASP